MKPGDIIKVKLGGDVHEAEVVKENPKTVLVKVLWSKTKHRKVKASKIVGDALGMEQMSLFDPLGTGSVKVPYIARGSKIIKIPKAKIVLSPTSTEVKEFLDKVADGHVEPKPYESEPPPTPAPQETVVEEVLVPKSTTKRLAMQTGKPDPFAELEAAIKRKSDDNKSNS